MENVFYVCSEGYTEVISTVMLDEPNEWHERVDTFFTPKPQIKPETPVCTFSTEVYLQILKKKIQYKQYVLNQSCECKK